MPDKSWLSDFCSAMRNQLDSKTADIVLKGYESQSEDNMDQITEWLIGVMARFDQHVDTSLKNKIMKQMGYKCAIQHNAHIDAKKKLDQFASLDEYIANDKYAKKEGDKIIVTYHPQDMGVKCYCSAWQPIKDGAKTSLTYCQCSAGHVEYIWRYLTGKEVEVAPICSCISGSDCCKFEMTI